MQILNIYYLISTKNTTYMLLQLLITIDRHESINFLLRVCKRFQCDNIVLFNTFFITLEVARFN